MSGFTPPQACEAVHKQFDNARWEIQLVAVALGVEDARHWRRYLGALPLTRS